MTTADAPGPRIDAAKAAAIGLIDGLPDNATIGLTTYGTGTGSSPEERPAGCQDVTTLTPLGTLDRADFAEKIAKLTPSGYTPISLALHRAADQLPTDGSAQAIVLVSDGEDTCDTPPCDVAASLKQTHPGLTISTVGFRTDGPASAQLACIAQASGGVFVQAGNADQLAARLIAVQNVDEANRSLSSDGIGDIKLGQTADDIRRAHGDFPEVGDGRVVVQYVDCDFEFVDRTLTSIAPHDGGRTIDGVTPGTDLSRVTELYGAPAAVDTNASTVIYRADSTNADSDAGYRITVDELVERAGEVLGKVKTIVLCRCAPKAEPDIVVLKPVDASGNAQAGWQLDTSRESSTADCTSGSPSPYDVDSSALRCSPNALQADACWPTAQDSVLCLQDPFQQVVTQFVTDGGIEPPDAQAEPPYPLGLELDDGSQCRAVLGGSWGSRGAPDYLCQGYPDFIGIWSSSHDEWHGITKGPDGWTVATGSNEGPDTRHRVTKAYFVGRE